MIGYREGDRLLRRNFAPELLQVADLDIFKPIILVKSTKQPAAGDFFENWSYFHPNFGQFLRNCSIIFEKTCQGQDAVVAGLAAEFEIGKSEFEMGIAFTPD